MEKLVKFAEEEYVNSDEENKGDIPKRLVGWEKNKKDFVHFFK